jgi:hypothetical protein
MHKGCAVLVYAVAESGRHQALVPTRWEHYAKLYNLRKHQAAQVDVWENKIKPRREAKKAKKRNDDD